MKRLRAVPVVGVLALAACAEPPVSPEPSLVVAPAIAALKSGPQSYLILGSSESLPENLAAAVESAGGSLVDSHPEIGVAFATSSSASFASKLARASGIESVTPDVVVPWTLPSEGRASALEFGAESSIGSDEGLFGYQWALPAVQAPDAWNAGYTGAGVRVAIVDGGIASFHPDLAPNLDVASSRSFVAGQPFDFDVDRRPNGSCVQQNFWHGTHVAGIVAAADNASGTIGIAPDATIIGVKVLHCGVGSFQQILNGILYAARPIASGGAGADVINLSLGAVVDEKDKAIKAAVRELKKAVDRATKYAHYLGITVVAAAGNDGIDYDAANELFKTPAQNDYVISVSATGPVGWAYNGATNFSDPTFYTDFGKSLVTVAAPGGTSALFTIHGVDEFCNVGGFVTFCETFDMVLSTTASGWGWTQGTSMAAPVVSGIAALIIQRNGGSATPAEVRARLQQGALDLGKPGEDAFFGQGWVNAFRSIR